MEPKNDKPVLKGMSMKGQYIAVGAILGVGAGLLFGNLAACAVIGVGLGFVFGMMKEKQKK